MKKFCCPKKKKLSRRVFLSYLGGVALTTSSLTINLYRDIISSDKGFHDENAYLHLGSGDVAILNYVYALEQLEAAFYTELIRKPFLDISVAEQALFISIRDHEIAHRDFFRDILAEDRISELEIDFSSVDFSSRASVLDVSKAIEELGVSAYCGLEQLIDNLDYLFIIGNIASLEACHAALINDLIYNNSSVDTGLDQNSTYTLASPAKVMDVASKYIKTKLNIKDLPWI
jgi:hypothetical protein